MSGRVTPAGFHCVLSMLSSGRGRSGGVAAVGGAECPVCAACEAEGERAEPRRQAIKTSISLVVVDVSKRTRSLSMDLRSRHNESPSVPVRRVPARSLVSSATRIYPISRHQTEAKKRHLSINRICLRNYTVTDLTARNVSLCGQCSVLSGAWARMARA